MHGYAINPARDLGPRLFVWLMGFKNTGFADGVWIVPVVGPIVGGILGAKVFDWTIKE
jgi:glycerol uptake facilitator protein